MENFRRIKVIVRCPRYWTPECNKDKCSIWGTERCVKGIPVPGKCSNRYTPRCGEGKCALFGTPKCVDGVVIH
jgi:hypothetical protein